MSISRSAFVDHRSRVPPPVPPVPPPSVTEGQHLRLHVVLLAAKKRRAVCCWVVEKPTLFDDLRRAQKDTKNHRFYARCGGRAPPKRMGAKEGYMPIPDDMSDYRRWPTIDRSKARRVASGESTQRRGVFCPLSATEKELPNPEADFLSNPRLSNTDDGERWNDAFGRSHRDPATELRSSREAHAGELPRSRTMELLFRPRKTVQNCGWPGHLEDFLTKRGTFFTS